MPPHPQPLSRKGRGESASVGTICTRCCVQIFSPLPRGGATGGEGLPSLSHNRAASSHLISAFLGAFVSWW
jgi:hypothetical protein